MGPEFFISYMSFSYIIFLLTFQILTQGTLVPPVSQLTWENASVICSQMCAVSCAVTVPFFFPLSFSLSVRTSHASCTKLCCLSQKSSLFFSQEKQSTESIIHQVFIDLTCMGSQHHILMMDETWQKLYIGFTNYKCKFKYVVSWNKCQIYGMWT